MLPRLLVSGLAIILGTVAAPAQTSTPSDRVVPGTPAVGHPSSPELTPEMRGDIFMARKMYREAIEAFRQGSPTDPVLWNKIGIAYHQMQELGSAKKSYEHALKLKKDYVEAINNLGTVYYAQKSYRRAVGWYKKAINLAANEPKSSSIYMNLGTAYFARKKYEDATKAYQVALQLDPQVFERQSSYGVLLEERSVEERAKYHFYVAKLYAKDGRNELAIQYLRKALEEGYKERKHLEETPEFAGLKDLPEFKELLAREPRVL
jgi:tetratricopeptide (TPR) repeat protein